MREDYELVLYHHGIKGMKWGVRRYQNKDGSLTPVGKRHLAKSTDTKDSNTASERKRGLTNKQKTILKVGAAAVGTALAAYGGYKLSQFVKNKNVDIATQKGKAAVKTYAEKVKLHVEVFGSGGRSYPERAVVFKTGGDKWHKVGESVVNAWENKSPGAPSHSDFVKRVQSMNERNKQTIMATYVDRAKNDSFGTAARNVASYYLDKRRKK